MSKVISYRALARQQQLNYLKHKDREYREREDFLGRTQKLLFQLEAQLRQAEMQQLEVFRELAAHFKIPLNFPDLGDRVGLQRWFATDPFLQILQAFFAGRLAPRSASRKSWNCRGTLVRPGKIKRRAWSPAKTACPRRGGREFKEVTAWRCRLCNFWAAFFEPAEKKAMSA